MLLQTGLEQFLTREHLQAKLKKGLSTWNLLAEKQDTNHTLVKQMLNEAMTSTDSPQFLIVSLGNFLLLKSVRRDTFTRN